nr:PREDICTED: neuropeptide CCHamide-1 receptor-like [Bemisia tabaci]
MYPSLFVYIPGCSLLAVDAVNGTESPESDTTAVIAATKLTVPIVFGLIFLVGLLGNGTLVLIFARHPFMRNVPNIYIVNLALGDLLVIVCAVPFTTTIYTFDEWPYGPAICRLTETTKDISIGVSVFTLTALSAERYYIIVDPIKRHLSSRTWTIVMVLVIWLISIIFSIPSAVFSRVHALPDANNESVAFCDPFPAVGGVSYGKPLVVFKCLVFYALPLSVIAAYYVKIARHLVNSARNIPGEIQGQHAQIQARKKVAKIVLIFVIIFSLCFLPYHIYMLWYYLHPTSNCDYNLFWHVLKIVGFSFSFINSCINPIALYFISDTFRSLFDRYLFCRRKTFDGRHAKSSITSRRTKTELG